MDEIKIVEAQRKFANTVYQEFISHRFGITPCCYTDVESAKIKKYLCDWQNLKIEEPATVNCD